MNQLVSVKPNNPAVMREEDCSFVLFLQVNMLHIFDGMGQEAFTQATEFLDGIGGEEFQSWAGTAFFLISGRRRQQIVQAAGDDEGSGLG